MNISTAVNRKLLAASVLAISFLLGLAIIRVQAAASDSSINLKKDNSTGLFVLTIRDPDGILEFSMTPAGKLPYSGGLSGCKKSFTNNTASFADPDDFTPVMPAFIVDCKNNKTELEIPPPVDGATKSVAVRKEEPPSPPPPPPPPQETKEVKKEGPLSAEDIKFPVPELGNCKNETECRFYCDVVDNAKECFAFAKKYNLISEEEAQKAADQFLNVKNGPGGCSSGKSCEDYCGNVDNLDECIAFAEKTGYYSQTELAEARKFQEMVKSGAQFPGGCKDRNTCELYCNDSSNMEECLNFAEETGFLPKEEIEQARKILPLMKSGETPGKCSSREQCEKYCSADEHLDECIAFADKAGLLSDEEREMIKKTGGKGPGGCRGKEQCETYCEVNGEECFKFAREHGLMSEADLAQMSEGMKRFREELDKMPPEAVECMKDAAGEENFNKMLAGEPVFDRGMEGKMKSCFGQITAQVSQQFNALPPDAVQCIKDTVGEEGLQKLQSGEFDENVDFSKLEVCFQQLQTSFGAGQGGPGGPGGGGFSGPGGCTSIDECTDYCTANPEECKDFGPPSGGGGGGGGMQGGLRPSRGGGASPGCSFMDFKPVCATFDGDRKVTFNNECFAKDAGADVNIISGACPEHQPCENVRAPVCGKKGNTIQSYYNLCVANDYREPPQPEILHTGECTEEEIAGGGLGGPGNCRSQEECIAYCTTNYTDSACALYIGGDQAPSIPVEYQQQNQQQGGACPEYVSVTECPVDQERFLSHDSPGCQLYSCRPKQLQSPQIPASGGGGSGGGTGILITPEICANFTNVPACSYVGSPDSQNYQLCVQCYPDKTSAPTSKATTPDALLAVPLAPLIQLLGF